MCCDGIATYGTYALRQVFSDLAGVLHKILFFEDIENGECGSAGKMIAAEGGSQLSIDRFELWCYEYTTHRETVGYAFSYRYDVGTDA